MTQIVLTSGTSWAVPGDFNPSDNKIEAIGGGGAGVLGDPTGGGGGGGASNGAGDGGHGKQGVIVITYTPLGGAELMGQVAA
jgi:hypothetical protein